ncbi:DNA replication and repair protein RecO [Propionibacterium cyclohexanicum]|uniref:DNA repair protein RecO n=1 Tax=Propionibacterium cyclohexanicum TaxID=64702 RepID=A0A1H9Q7Z3_9ACTN|nr:DNA replication and repair protein RecO [Propionibacterium cyclohexanicum]
MLRTHKLGEADRIVTILCRSQGKVRAVARGVRRTSSKFGARLEPFSHVDVQFAVGRSLDIVTQVQCLHPYGDPLARDYGLYCSGETMLEVADRLVAVEKEPSLRQYRLLLGGLRVLGEGTSDGPRPASMVLDSYLLRALAAAGYAPVLDSCAHCGLAGPHEWFSPSSGGMVCSRCKPPASAHPSAQSWALLGAMISGDWPATREVRTATVRECAGLVAAFAAWHMDHSLRSLAMIPRE